MTMGSWGELNAGPFTLFFFKDMVPNDLICLFQDRMYSASIGRASTRYALGDKPDYDVEFFEYKATGRLIADRLDILGFDIDSALEVLRQSIGDNFDSPPWFEGMGRIHPEWVERWEAERAALAELDTDRWLKAIASVAATQRKTVFEPPDQEPVIGSGKWLLNLIPDESEYARWHRLRLVTHAVPDIGVILNVSDLVHDGWLVKDELDTMPSVAQERWTAESSARSPIVVLTEGSTDAEFLRAGLKLLFPHLTDLVRFLDPRARSEGSAGALVNTVKAFAAAGITNRIVAAFDDDGAASDALKQLKAVALPPNIVIMQFPLVPVSDALLVRLPPLEGRQQSTGDPRNARISGCVETYLGSDTIRGDDNVTLLMDLAPHHRDPGQHEARFVDKRNKKKVQDNYRRKVRAAVAHGGPLPNQDWSAMAAALKCIVTAHQTKL
ncbi:hypothetical protein ACQEVC_34300 [Plantactinospora sp. CA-294935]|uniref:hypothetical protein n=1 Tax=Plantactinospora sp. CA-294935 TaxID=3240012 RepID=UPI003D8F36DE